MWTGPPREGCTVGEATERGDKSVWPGAGQRPRGGAGRCNVQRERQEKGPRGHQRAGGGGRRQVEMVSPRRPRPRPGPAPTAHHHPLQAVPRPSPGHHPCSPAPGSRPASAPPPPAVSFTPTCGHKEKVAVSAGFCCGCGPVGEAWWVTPKYCRAGAALKCRCYRVLVRTSVRDALGSVSPLLLASPWRGRCCYLHLPG